jgi:hypothetical protein
VASRASVLVELSVDFPRSCSAVVYPGGSSISLALSDTHPDIRQRNTPGSSLVKNTVVVIIDEHLSIKTICIYQVYVNFTIDYFRLLFTIYALCDFEIHTGQ